MNVDEIKGKLIGRWTGHNVLRLSWMNPPEYRSPSELTIAQAVGGKFLSLSYNWSHEDAPHEGLLLIGFDLEKEIVNASWADSWHSGTKPLALSGSVDERGAIDLRGTYEVPNHPDWGWRIVIETPEDALQVVMYNVSPEGKEDLAVRADYTKGS